MQPADRHFFLFTATLAPTIGRAAKPMLTSLTQYIGKPKPQYKLRVSSFAANSDVSVVHTVSQLGGGGREVVNNI